MALELFSEVLGRKVQVPGSPERIVSLAPAITETLFLLGLSDRVVAVSHFCNKPPEAREKPRIGSYFQVNYEKLEALQPDLVLVTTGAQRRLALELAEKGYPVYPIPLPVSVPGVIDMALQVGLVTGAIREARELTGKLTRRLAGIQPLSSPLRAYYEIDLGGPVSVGALSYIGDALDRLGLNHPFQNERQPWIINPDPAVIAKYDPQVIIYEKAPYKPYKDERIIEELASRGLGDTEAMEKGNVIILPPDSLAHYGPSLIGVLEELSHRLSEIEA